MPATTDEFTPNRPEDAPKADLFEPDMLDERVATEFEVAAENPPRLVADVAAPEPVAPRPFPAVTPRAPPEEAEPKFRENVAGGVPARFPAAVFPLPRLPIAPAFPEFRAVIDEPGRPAPNLPPFMPLDREP